LLIGLLALRLIMEQRLVFFKIYEKL